MLQEFVYCSLGMKLTEFIYVCVFVNCNIGLQNIYVIEWKCKYLCALERGFDNLIIGLI